MQIKTTVRYHLTAVRMAFIKEKSEISVGKDMEKKNPLCTVDGRVHWFSLYGKQYEGSSKN